MSEQPFLARMANEFATKQARAERSLPERLSSALLGAALLSSAGSAQLDRESARGKPGSAPPPSVNSLQFDESDESVLDFYHRRFHLMISALEREVDATKLRPVSADLVRETSVERERRLIQDFEGVPAWEVTFIDRSFGSPRSVERTRVKHGRRPKDGQAMPKLFPNPTSDN